MSNTTYTQAHQTGMFLVVPVPFLIKDNQLFVEDQALSGIQQWSRNFDSIIVAAPVMPESIAQQETTIAWQSAESLIANQNIKLILLPWAYKLSDFIANYQSVRSRFAELIAQSQYLQFAIGGLVGDWAAIAALEAHKQGRKFAIHTDRVEHEVILKTAKNLNWKKRVKTQIISPLMARYHHWIIQRCSLGLWHGNDCYAAYRELCSNSYLIHDLHVDPKDCIRPDELFDKGARAFTDPVLRICYAGRMEAMKAPLEWLQAIAHARDLGAKIHAIWLGDGSLRQAMKMQIQQLKLETVVELAGFESNRGKVLAKIREAHLMLFTHITPESPRCLIESLLNGTPIIGYQSEFASGLIEPSGGGEFVPTHDAKQLAEKLVQLFHDRQYLAQLMQNAVKSSNHFSTEAVFQDRSALIKKHL